MSELTKKWKQYINTRDSEIFNTIYKESSIFVFMIAYNVRKKKSDAIEITAEVYQRLRNNPQNSESFEDMLTSATKELCELMK